ncbi:MAG: HAMP domain-containing protein [SAR202 cluster bacterium]|nr:HAMP domain-containing protein [SAR202 cluster bacterium]
MAVNKWFSSLQFRLLLGFTFVLILALGGVSLYVGYAAQNETERYQEEVAAARAQQVQHVVTEMYSTRRDWSGVEVVLERAGDLYGWRMVLSDREGRVVADSHRERFGPWKPRPHYLGGPSEYPFVSTESRPLAKDSGSDEDTGRMLPIVNSGNQVGSLAIEPNQELALEPPLSRLASSINRSLVWTGIAALLAGVAMVFLVSQRILAPVKSLNTAALRLGRGDLTQRVPVEDHGDMGRLAQTFNVMAENLEKAEQQRRHMVADVAHELRTPLSNIRGYLEAVKDGVVQADAQTIDTIYQQVLHLSRLVEDLRLLALAEAGALKLDRQPESMEELMKKSVDAFSPRATAKGLTLTLDAASSLPLVSMDRTRISQVLSNLLDNAIFHTPEGGRVSVESVEAGGKVRVSVSDTGIGIPQEALAHIFDRFYRVDPSRARATGGAGLGLTIARQIVEAHGGSIGAESAPGLGSVFTFELPVITNQTF